MIRSHEVKDGVRDSYVVPGSLRSRHHGNGYTCFRTSLYQRKRTKEAQQLTLERADIVLISRSEHGNWMQLIGFVSNF